MSKGEKGSESKLKGKAIMVASALVFAAIFSFSTFVVSEYQLPTNPSLESIRVAYVDANYSILAMIKVQKIADQIKETVADWLVNSQTGYTSLKVTYSWSVSVSGTTLTEIDIYVYLKCTTHGTSWWQWGSHTHTSLSGNNYFLRSFDSINSGWSHNLADSSTHTLHIGMKVVIIAGHVTADSGIVDIGNFNLKYYQPVGGGIGGALNITDIQTPLLVVNSLISFIAVIIDLKGRMR